MFMQNSHKKSNFLCVIGRHWVGCLVLVLILAISVLHLNQPLFYKINGIHTILPDSVWNTINYITYTKYGILPIVLIIITLAFKRDKITLVVLIYLVNIALLSIIKSLVGEARPFVVLPHDTFFWLNTAEDAFKTAHKSFPSGHTGNAAIFVFTLIKLFSSKSNKFKSLQFVQNSDMIQDSIDNQHVMNKFVKIVLLLFLFLVGLARVCTGWHWPLDVLVSGLIGYIIVEISFYLAHKKVYNGFSL